MRAHQRKGKRIKRAKIKEGRAKYLNFTYLYFKINKCILNKNKQTMQLDQERLSKTNHGRQGEILVKI